MADEKETTSDLSTSPKIHFEPVINLPIVETKTLEEEEDELLKLRAKLFRYDSKENPPEWKERGMGDVKILRQKDEQRCRLLMRRDKTLKICANHYISPAMELKPNCGSDRAWVWSVTVDYADEEPKPELLAIRFANAENAQKFRKVFEEAQKLTSRPETEGASDSEKNDKADEDPENDNDGNLDAKTEELSEKLKKLGVCDESNDSSVTNDVKKEETESSTT